MLSLAKLFGFGSPEKPQERIIVCDIANAITYQIKPEQMGSAQFDWFVRNTTAPDGVIWC